MNYTRIKIAFACLALCAGPLAILRAEETPTALSSLYQPHDYTSEEAALKAALASNPEDAEANYRMACLIITKVWSLASRNGAQEDAAKAQSVPFFEKALQNDPKNPAYLRDGAIAFVTGLGNLRKCRRMLETAIELDPKDPNTHFWMAKTYDTPWPFGDNAKMLKHFDAFESLDHEHAWELRLNRLLWQDRNLKKAMEYTAGLLSTQPENATANYLYARACAETGLDLERGLACAQKALKLPPAVCHRRSPFMDPFSSTPSYYWEHIAKILVKLERKSEALEAYKNALQVDPSNYWANKGYSELVRASDARLANKNQETGSSL